MPDAPRTHPTPDHTPATEDALPLPCASYLRVIHEQSDAFGAALAGDPWSLRVPMSSTWTVADLTRHLGQVHRWATAIVTSGRRGPRPEAPVDTADLAVWFADGARKLVAALRVADPSATCWTFAADQHVAFWYRRQAHETTIHRWDVESAAGTPRPIDALLAADGVDEALSVALPRAAERFGDPPRLRGPLAIQAIDTGHRWLLDPSRDGHPPSVARPADGDGIASAATLSGTATDLLLSLWRRIEPTDLTVAGDPQVVEDLWAGRLTT